MASTGEEEFQRQFELEQKEKQETENAHTHTDPTDGTVYEWDGERKAWFPKVDDDFIAAYQASYGVNTSTEDTTLEKEEEDKATSSGPQGEDPASTKQKGQKRKGDEGWFQIDEEKNTNVYISGLPDDITMDEYRELMSKCGIIMEEEETGTQKLKLYKDSEGNNKGDGLCTYLKRESVQLAIQILDGYDLRGKTVHVEQAQFAAKGAYDPTLKKKKKKNNKKKKKQNAQERLLTWRPEKKFQQRKRNEQVVIIKHMFDPKEFEEDAMLINEIRDDLRAECSKFGEVNKVLIFDNHPEGVTSVRFKDIDDADKCVAAMNGRWFAARQLTAELWDGTTDYKVEETDQEREGRLAQWEKFLEDDKKPGGAAGGDEKAPDDSGKVAEDSGKVAEDSGKVAKDSVETGEDSGKVEKDTAGSGDQTESDRGETLGSSKGGTVEAGSGGE